jgi:hypothetical protein
MRIPLLSAICSVLLVTSTRGEWKPAAGPLMTRWAKDVSPETVHPDYPRPQMVRKDWKNLNGLWQLAFAKEGEDPPVGKELSEQILVPFPVESALSGIMKRTDRLWYRRTFSVPAEWKGKQVLLHLGAVDWETTVWVNGKKLGEHRGGYDPFSFDVTEALKPEGEQELIVGVWDPTDKGTQPRGKQVNNPRGIYYTPTTGIWQTVWLEPVSKTYITGLKIVPDVDAGKVTVTIHAHNAGAKHRGALILMDGKKGRVTVCKVNEPVEITVPNARLWSPEDPFLYELWAKIDEVEEAKRISTGTEVDFARSYFGMRKIAVGKDDKGVNRLLLNGKPLFMVGPLDQGFWPDGLYTAPTDEALKYDIEITKKFGFNMTRKHVKVEPARWYYWCDKLGLVVWQDMPSGDKSVAPNKGEITRTPESAKQYEIELKSMIENLHNHPSIVMWVVFNEGWGQFDTQRITEWTKKYDPTRLVNCASGWNDMNCGDVHDIHVYPGPGAPPLEENRAAVLGEFGGLGLGVDGHTWSKQTWGYRGTASQEDLMRKYERLLREAWRLKEEKGLCAAVYTQITDVETEANGLLTYDRAVIKMDLDRAGAANRGDFSKVPDLQVVVPTSKEEGQKWRYTVEKPADDWFKPEFDASSWAEGVGGFGTKGTPGAVVRTEWKTSDIWLRREFVFPQGALDGLSLLIHHDEDVEVYLNGVLATKLPGFITDYEDTAIAPEALKALKPGKNVMAVHCKQTGGGQYIDVGLVGVKKK